VHYLLRLVGDALAPHEEGPQAPLWVHDAQLSASLAVLLLSTRLSTPCMPSGSGGTGVASRLPPPGLQVPEVRLGGVGVLKSVKFTELCSFDSESSEKKILLIKYVFLLRSW
jgi:hypothetical protein